MHFVRLSLFLALPTLLAAQASTEPVFRSESNLVEVSVTARDHRDQPLLGLKQNDFELYEGKERQKIRVFVPPYNANSAKEALSPRRFTNQASGVTSRAGLTVFLLDWVNSGYESSLRLREDVATALALLPKAEMKGIYVLTADRLSLIHSLTQDGPSLLKTLQLSPLPSVAPPTNTFSMRVREIFESFDLIAKQLAAIPGRKTLIWASNGFPIARGVEQDINRAIDTLNRSNITVYAVDSRRLIPGGPFGKVDPWVNADVMQRIALRTGGLLYLNRNDVDNAMTQATQDAYASYILGYYRSTVDALPANRRISVKVTSPGVSVSVGERQSRTPSARTSQESIPGGAQIGLNVDVFRRENMLALRLQVGMSSFTLLETGNIWQGEGRIQFHFLLADSAESERRSGMKVNGIPG